MKRYVLICLTLYAFLGVSRADDWAPNGSSGNGVALYTKSVPDSDYKRFKGEVTIDAPLRAVLAVLMVRDTYTKWWYNMLQVTTLDHDNPGFSLAYYWIKGVWPTADRDAVVDNEVEQDPQSLEVVFHSRSADASLVSAQSSRVRLKRVDTIIRAIPLSGSQTKVVLEGSGDPGGTVPSWLANGFILDTPKKSLENLRSLLQDKDHPVDVNALKNDPFAKIHMPAIRLPN